MLNAVNNKNLIKYFMKKLITSIAVMAICSTAAYAQETANTNAAVKSEAHGKMMRKEKREERMKDASPEQKERMMERKEKFKSLSPEKQQEVKSEMKRHREEMHSITGEEHKAK